MKTSTIFAVVTMAFASFAAASPTSPLERAVAATKGNCDPDNKDNHDELNGHIPSKRDIDVIDGGEIDDELEARDFLEARKSDPCCNSGQVKRHLDKFKGSCQPEGKRLFKKSSHNCADIGGKSYLCVFKDGDQYISKCLTGKSIKSIKSEKGECFLSN